ncbi:MAG: tyrosinase family protein, partial [Nitrospira sp.]|nr:tyrosinase family protein [Nitrospira sp.]
GVTGTLNLFTSNFMGYGGSSPAPIGEPWLSAGYYVPGANPHRDVTGNPADPPRTVTRFVAGSPASVTQDQTIVAAGNYATMRSVLEDVHNAMHRFVNMGGQHISFRDPFVFLLHSNVDRLFALWQIQPSSPQRLDPNLVYGPESGDPGLNSNIEPWSTGHSFDQFGIEHFARPWYAPENQGIPKTYKHPSVVRPPHYDTLPMYPLPRNLACDQIVQFTGTSPTTGDEGAYVEAYNSLSTFTSGSEYVELRFGNFTFDYSSGPTIMELDVRFVLDGRPQVATRFERGSQCQLSTRVLPGFAGTHILYVEVRSVLIGGPPIDCHISGMTMLKGTSLSSIREAAYFHWLNRGRPVGDDWADWFWAEQL